MIDECGEEFGVTFDAATRDEAEDWLRESYPESRLDQLEDPQDTAARERRMYASIQAEEDGDFTQWEYEREWG
jgi:hypothetical protein